MLVGPTAYKNHAHGRFSLLALLELRLPLLLTLQKLVLLLTERNHQLFADPSARWVAPPVPASPSRVPVLLHDAAD